MLFNKRSSSFEWRTAWHFAGTAQERRWTRSGAFAREKEAQSS